ncbi:MAG: dioxygenase [Asgard group archaeon]|nr:dioxygenase [Asgard group archaeon]
MSQLPALFIGHGSPNNLFADNPFTNTLKSFGKNLFDNHHPKAIVVISAHWLTHGTFITADEKPRMIYDYYGFPKSFYEYVYPAKGAPNTANDIADPLNGIIRLSKDWGIDHAATIVLENILPSGKIPVLELSLDFDKQPKYHYELGQKLAPFREKGILFIGSGNLIHTFRELSYDISAASFNWAKELDAIQKQALDTHNLDDLLNITKMSLNKRGFQSLDHYLPMLYILAMKQNDEQLEYIYEGLQHGSISHRSFVIQS